MSAASSAGRTRRVVASRVVRDALGEHDLGAELAQRAIDEHGVRLVDLAATQRPRRARRARRRSTSTRPAAGARPTARVGADGGDRGERQRRQPVAGGEHARRRRARPRRACARGRRARPRPRARTVPSARAAALDRDDRIRAVGQRRPGGDLRARAPAAASGGSSPAATRERDGHRPGARVGGAQRVAVHRRVRRTVGGRVPRAHGLGEHPAGELRGETATRSAASGREARQQQVARAPTGQQVLRVDPTRGLWYKRAGSSTRRGAPAGGTRARPLSELATDLIPAPGRYRLGRELRRRPRGRPSAPSTRRAVAPSSSGCSRAPRPTSRRRPRAARSTHPGIIRLLESGCATERAGRLPGLRGRAPTSRWPPPRLARDPPPWPMQPRAACSPATSRRPWPTCTAPGWRSAALDADRVLLDADGRPKLLDDRRCAARAPSPAALIAPELVRGDRATPAADLYALGALLHVLLTGRATSPGDAHRRRPVGIAARRGGPAGRACSPRIRPDGRRRPAPSPAGCAPSRRGAQAVGGTSPRIVEDALAALEPGWLRRSRSC